MRSERLSVYQLSCLYALMLLGDTVFIGIGGGSGRAAWLAAFIAMFASLPFILTFVRISRLFPQMSAYQTIVTILGKAFGNIVIALYVWYSIEMCALIIRGNTQFIQVMTMPNTPQYVMMTALLLLCIWCAKSGLLSMGRCALYGLPVITIIILFTSIVGIKDIKMDYIFPVTEVGAKGIWSAVFSTFAFPYMETITLSTQVNVLRPRDNPYKAVISGIIIGGVLLTIATFRNVMLSGPALNVSGVFPGYNSVGIVSLGSFFTRFEAVISASLLIASFLKASIALYVATKGLGYLLKVKDYRDLVVPMALFCAFLILNGFDNMIQMLMYVDAYPYYSILFQIVLPVFLWIMGEVKARKLKKRGIKPAGMQSPDATLQGS